jgi:HTH-type transcriptional regulator, sugar sensing transcriptional regulator
MTLERLGQLGLTKGEIKVYEALLKLGESTKTPIASESEVSPGKVYDVLDRLVRKGLASTITKKGVKHFRVTNPNRFADYLNQKKQAIALEEQVLTSIMPIMVAQYTATQDSTDAELYKGWDGLESAYKVIADTLKPGETDYILGGSAGSDIVRTQLFFSHFNALRCERKIRVWMIYNEKDKGALHEHYQGLKADQIRFLPIQTLAEIHIFGDNVMIAILTETPLAILIRSKVAAQSFRQYFDTLWKIGAEDPFRYTMLG